MRGGFWRVDQHRNVRKRFARLRVPHKTRKVALFASVASLGGVSAILLRSSAGSKRAEGTNEVSKAIHPEHVGHEASCLLGRSPYRCKAGEEHGGKGQSARRPRCARHFPTKCGGEPCLHS
ncbi:hypothetical protein IE81DRAFT_227858 [Ceraceosorus guamensis]|uniref:Uncharacterized protein n=1 Tax=Ceraceosorus guamensis TaxID=1522189 RepID=A0A316WBW8_9BASI|nr:hypothetical protein IE81DRAFT_227858 [Ceraceosorus guamensis]PWN45065.1 hypothetical protein IE81DRAFT_227858 [Ceraceosorus guamensis]